MAVSVAVCEIFSVKEWCNLENRVRVRVKVRIMVRVRDRVGKGRKPYPSFQMVPLSMTLSDL